MRLSKFHKELIITIFFIFTCVGLNLIRFETTYRDSFIIQLSGLLIMVFKPISCIIFFFYTIILSHNLRDLIALKYKVTNVDGVISVKYLTCWYLFIPYWKPIKSENWGSLDFGLFNQFSLPLNLEKTYTNDNKALIKLKEHHLKVKKRQAKFFKIPKRKNKTVKYFSIKS